MDNQNEPEDIKFIRKDFSCLRYVETDKWNLNVKNNLAFISRILVADG